MKWINFVCWTTVTASMSLLTACGSGKKSDDDSTPRGKIESAFFSASVESGVPMRLMMAVGYVESGLRPERSSALYLGGGQSGIDFGDSAFGLSFNDLALTKDVGAGSAAPAGALESQVRAYGKFLKEKFKSNALPVNAVTPEEKFRWIWRLAELHHGGDQLHRNLWSVFAHEMITTLNKGFEIKDVETGEIVKLEKETPEIKEDQLPKNLQQDLALDKYSADIHLASLFSLTSAQPIEGVNQPKRVEVIHCPFSLSTCVDLQKKRSESSARLSAHYIIPRDETAAPEGLLVLQMARHSEPVELTDVNGKTEIVTNRIVIMLAGNSGRYVDGMRSYANSLWLTSYQLRLLGAAIREVCGALERPEGVNIAACVATSGDAGVLFRNQPAGNYRWGDISDFDESIFYPYVANESGAASATTLETGDGRLTYDAGSPFTLIAKFQSGARRVEMERLIRCGDKTDKRIIWEPAGYPQIRNVTSKSFDFTYYDAGPNGNGDQFFRAKVFGEGSKFLGWAIQQVQLRNVKEGSDSNEALSKYCIRNGT